MKGGHSPRVGHLVGIPGREGWDVATNISGGVRSALDCFRSIRFEFELIWEREGCDYHSRPPHEVSMFEAMVGQLRGLHVSSSSSVSGSKCSCPARERRVTGGVGMLGGHRVGRREGIGS